MPHTLVTGAAGFIGSTLSDRLVGRGVKVRGVDAFIDYYPREMKMANLAALRESDLFELVEGDLSELSMDELLDGVDTVFHQAAQAGVRSSWGAEFDLYTRCNILATQRLLEACKGRNIRFVYASSSSVYGDAERLPAREEDPAIPISPYGVTKLAAEHLCRLYWKSFGVHTISLRYFTVYGPRQRPDMAFHKWIRATLEGEPIIVYGDGLQSRDFTFVDDIVDANLAAVERGEPGCVYNLGGGSTVTVKEVLEMIGETCGRKYDVRHVDRQKGDARHTSADTSAAQRVLDFEPRVRLQEGIRREVEWLQNLLSSTPAAQ